MADELAVWLYGERVAVTESYPRVARGVKGPASTHADMGIRSRRARVGGVMVLVSAASALDSIVSLRGNGYS